MKTEIKKAIIFLTVLTGVFLFAKDLEAATPYYNWNEIGASGTNWPGWTWSSDADGYGSPGWKKNNGYEIITSVTNRGWGPRSHAKQDYGNRVLATIDTNNRAPSTLAGASLKVYDAGGSLIYGPSWWFIPPNALGSPGGGSYTNTTTDRMSFYFKLDRINDPRFTTDPDIYNVHIGT